MGITKIPSLGYEGLVDWLLERRSGLRAEQDFSGKYFPIMKEKREKKKVLDLPSMDAEQKFLWPQKLKRMVSGPACVPAGSEHDQRFAGGPVLVEVPVGVCFARMDYTV